MLADDANACWIKLSVSCIIQVLLSSSQWVVAATLMASSSYFAQTGFTWFIVFEYIFLGLDQFQLINFTVIIFWEQSTCQSVAEVNVSLVDKFYKFSNLDRKILVFLFQNHNFNMNYRFHKKLDVFYLSNRYFQSLIRFKFSGKTPFEQNKATSSPFVTPRSTVDWNSSKVQKQVKPTIYPQPQPQKITPLNQSQDLPGPQLQIKSIRDPPPIDYKLFSTNKILNKEEDESDKTDSTTAEVTSSSAVPQQNTQTTAQQVMSDLGLNRYLSRVFTTTGISVVLTLAAAYTGMLIPNIAQIGDTMMFCSGLLSYGLFQKARTMDKTILSQVRKGEQILRTKNSFARLNVYGLGCIMLGFSVSPLFYSIHQISANILPLTMGVTSAIFGGASLMGFLLPRGAMLGYGSVLMGSLVGLIGLNFSGLLASKFLGIGLFASTLTTAESYIGIGLFSALLIFDTHTAIKRYKTGDADHLGMSIQILLDVMNLIIRIAREIAKHKNKK